MKLIAGLGNPGYEYAWTPHNLGFMAVDRLAEKCGVEVARPEAQALIARARLAGTDVIFAKPQTYMNLSGLSVSRLLDRYEIPAEQLIVLSDDLDLPFGQLRIRASGSAGSHNGLKSIIGAVQSDRFIRVRMGIRPEHEIRDRAGHVLGRFRNSELEAVAEMIDQAADSVEAILNEGVEKAMTRFNKKRPVGEL